MQIKDISKRVTAFALSLSMGLSVVSLSPNSMATAAGSNYQYKALGGGKAEITDYFGNEKQVTIPSKLGNYTVTSVAKGAFTDCDTIQSLIIPNSVTNISDGAFTECDYLKSVAIGSGVSSIGQGAFFGCNLLANITVDSGNSHFTADTNVLYNKNKSTLIFYAPAKTVTSYTIPATVTKIADDAFYNCNKLATLSVESGNKKYSSVNGVLFNKAKTTLIRYNPGKRDKSYTVPSSVKTIYDGAFADCDFVTSITVPYSVTVIGQGAFLDCEILKTVKLSTGVKKIEKLTFANCEELTDITLTNSLKEIDYFAFYECNSLDKVTFWGTSAQWGKISIGIYNNPLMMATVSYCKHSSTTVKNKKTASYFAKGYTGDKVCKSCGTVLSKGKSIAQKVLKKPIISVTSPKKKSFKVKYTKVSGATGFELRYKIKKKTYKKSYSTKNTVTKVIKKLKAGKYTVKVRAYVKSGKNKAYSAWVSRPITVK